MKREEIRIRDPFILVDEENKLYYMYGTTSLVSNSLSALPATYVYRSKDLESFDEPIKVFEAGKDFWADRDFWAPEVHKYNGKYYMLISLKSENHARATQILVSDTPDGQFKPISEKPQTPEDWECLDGTLWIEDGVPYMVFCHEWLQVYDGEMCAVRLSSDLTERVGEVKKLFNASENEQVISKFPGSEQLQGCDCFVTDGPFLYVSDGRLNMIWSSHTANGYAVFKAYSDGGVMGNWTQEQTPIFGKDGGHAMLFTDLDGEQKISLHQPNLTNFERAVFLPFEKE